MSLWLVLAGSCTALFAQAAPAGAKTYTWSTIDASYQDRRFVAAQKLAKSQVLFGKQTETASGNALSNWYRKYGFPRLASEGELGDPAKLREELLKDLNTTKDAKLHQTLVDIAYDEAIKLVQGNFHPTVRFNALLIVGSLNRMESRLAGKDRFPAARLPRALGFLVQEFKKPNSPDALRIAAMLGILRHVRLDRQRPQDDPILDAQKAEIVSLAEAMVNQKDPGPNQKPEGHTWLRCRAVDVLAAVGAVGTNLSVFNSVTALLSNDSVPMSLRYAAAEAVGHLEYTNVTGVDPVAVSRQLGSLAASACRSIDARVKEELEKENKPAKRSSMGGMGGMMGGSGGMGGMMGAPEGMMGGSGGMGGMMGAPEGMMGGMMGGMYGGGNARGSGDSEPDANIQRARRRLKLPLRCVLIGLQGEMQPKASSQVASFQALAQDDAQKDEIAKVVEAVNALVDATDQYEDGLEEMMKEVRVKVRELETLLPKSKAPDAPAAGTDLPGGDRPGA